MVRAGCFVSLAVSVCAAVTGAASQAWAESQPHELRGVGAAAAEAVGRADWRGEDFDGRTTASGDRFDMYQLTAASADLPLNSYAAVTNVATGESVVVRINDRAAPAAGGVIMLSFAAAHRLGVDAGASPKVRVAALGAAPPIAASQDAAGEARATGPGVSDLRLASLEDGLTHDPLDDVTGLRRIFRTRVARHPLTVTWAEDAPVPLAGL